MAFPNAFHLYRFVMQGADDQTNFSLRRDRGTKSTAVMAAAAPYTFRKPAPLIHTMRVVRGYGIQLDVNLSR
jgi:hypothetical protein